MATWFELEGGVLSDRGVLVAMADEEAGVAEAGDGP